MALRWFDGLRFLKPRLIAVMNLFELYRLLTHLCAAVEDRVMDSLNTRQMEASVYQRQNIPQLQARLILLHARTDSLDNDHGTSIRRLACNRRRCHKQQRILMSSDIVNAT